MKNLINQQILPQASMRYLIITLLAMLCAIQSHAQAFDGDADRKIFIGFHQLHKSSGAEGGYERGLSDKISVGMKLAILQRSYQTEAEKEKETGVNFSLFANYHFMDMLKLPDNFDIYAGAGLSFTSVDIHAGAKYNFSEVMGVYAEVHHNLFRTFNNTFEGKLVFPLKPGFSIGLTFNY